MKKTIMAMVLMGVASLSEAASLNCSRIIDPPLPNGGVRSEIFRLENIGTPSVSLSNYIMKNDGKTYAKKLLMTDLKCTIKDTLATCWDSKKGSVDVGRILKPSGGWDYLVAWNTIAENATNPDDYVANHVVIRNHEGHCRRFD